MAYAIVPEVKRLGWWVAAILFLGPVLFALTDCKHRPQKSLREVLEESHNRREAPGLAALNGWLEAQRKGQDGFCFWSKDAGRPVELFGVQSWEIVDKDGLGDYTVRIHSTNKAGIPIICLWKVLVTVEGKIHRVELAIKGQE